jgi:hypothetical protein
MMVLIGSNLPLVHIIPRFPKKAREIRAEL